MMSLILDEIAVEQAERGVLEWDLAAGARLGVMPGVGRSGVVDGVETTGFLGLVLGNGWGKRFRAFLELAFKHIAGSEAGGNAGGTYLLGEGTQLDAALSLPATSSASSVAFTVVLSQLSRW